MSFASRVRRRLMAAAILALGLVILAIRPYASGWDQIQGTLVGPAMVLHGICGLIYPPATLDPKPELGPAQLWLECGRWPFWLGFACLLTGMLLGAGLLLAS